MLTTKMTIMDYKVVDKNVFFELEIFIIIIFILDYNMLEINRYCLD